MWIISECLREWRELGEIFTVEELVEEAKKFDGEVSIFNPNDSIFMHPGPMISRIHEGCERSGVPIPRTKGALAKSIYLSQIGRAHV